MRDNQRGVAMVTVLFVGMVLTVVISSASFITIRELQQGQDDRRSADAMALAEAGIDRFVNEVRKGSYSWGQIRQAGCESAPISVPTGSISRGTFNAELVVFDPDAATPTDRLPPASCVTRPLASEPIYVAVTATGQRLAGTTSVATRTVRQVMRVAAFDQLPFGVFIDGRIDVNGNIDMPNVSLITTSDIVGRGKIGFTGTDPYYTQRNFYGLSGSTAYIPAAAHAMGHIYAGTGGKLTPEHPPNPNCTTNTRGTTGQSLWDSSGDGGTVTVGCTGQVGQPPTSKFSGLYDAAGNGPKPPTAGLTQEHYDALKNIAQSSGIYCKFATGSTSTSCTAFGASRTIDSKKIDAGDISGAPNNFVFYIDMPTSVAPFSSAQTVTWQTNWGPCSDTPGAAKSVILVIRNGSLTLKGNASVTGALLLPEGVFDSAGGFQTEGTIVAKGLRLRGGATLSMTDCWVRNVPGFLLELEPVHWAEVDR